MAADFASLQASLQALFEAGSNDASIMATGIATAIDTYAKTLTVQPGIALTATGANAGGPVASTGATIGIGTIS